MRSLPLVLLCLTTTVAVAGHAQGGKTYCNPVDLNYQYNFEQRERNISYRSGADPVLINHSFRTPTAISGTRARPGSP